MAGGLAHGIAQVTSQPREHCNGADLRFICGDLHEFQTDYCLPYRLIDDFDLRYCGVSFVRSHSCVGLCQVSATMMHLCPPLDDVVDCVAEAEFTTASVPVHYRTSYGKSTLDCPLFPPLRPSSGQKQLNQARI